MLSATSLNACLRVDKGQRGHRARRRRRCAAGTAGTAPGGRRARLVLLLCWRSWCYFFGLLSCSSHVFVAADAALVVQRCGDHARRTSHFTANDHSIIVEIGRLKLTRALLLIRSQRTLR